MQQRRTQKLLMGNEAVAYAALASGVKVVAGYPGTPSSEVIETIAAEKAAGRAHGVHVEWSTNEKVALELLAGASLAGARCLFACKQVGLNVASDALLSLNYIGIKGGLVLYVTDDPGPISSQTEQDTRRFAKFAKVPVFDPATVEQSFEMIQAAFELSELHQTPVIVRSSTRVCHSSAFIEVPEQRAPEEVVGFEKDSRWVIFPKRTYEAHGEIIERLEDISATFSRTAFNGITEDELLPSPPQLGIVAGGASASYAREALGMLRAACTQHGIALPHYRFMQIGTPHPFPREAALRFVEGLEAVLVYEELDLVIEEELLILTAQEKLTVSIYGKLTNTTLRRGENSIDDCYGRITRFFGVLDELECATKGSDASELSEVPIPTLPTRPPVLCAGCPHRGSFYAIKQAVKKLKLDAVYCGDIGCYTLGNAQPLAMVDTCLCMGAGITMAQGFSVVEKGKKQIAFVGDSTFFASGLPGIANAVYNDHDIMLVVLDNSITAMTGAQPHPGTGNTLMGGCSEPISIEAMLRASNFKHISKANPFSLEESIEHALVALEAKGPAALIFEAPCITLVRPSTPMSIDANKCTGCKRCIREIGCPAIGFDTDESVAFINETLCTGCKLCVSLCSLGVINEKKGGHDHD